MRKGRREKKTETERHQIEQCGLQLCVCVFERKREREREREREGDIGR
jgi:hypothetical protein